MSPTTRTVSMPNLPNSMATLQRTLSAKGHRWRRRNLRMSPALLPLSPFLSLPTIAWTDVGWDKAPYMYQAPSPRTRNNRPPIKCLRRASHRMPMSLPRTTTAGISTGWHDISSAPVVTGCAMHADVPGTCPWGVAATWMGGGAESVQGTMCVSMATTSWDIIPFDDWQTVWGWKIGMECASLRRCLTRVCSSLRITIPGLVSSSNCWMQYLAPLII
jgi:hypothetical protein